MCLETLFPPCESNWTILPQERYDSLILFMKLCMMLYYVKRQYQTLYTFYPSIAFKLIVIKLLLLGTFSWNSQGNTFITIHFMSLIDPYKGGNEEMYTYLISQNFTSNGWDFDSKNCRNIYICILHTI